MECTTPHFSYTVDFLDVRTMPVVFGRTATAKEGDREIGAKTATAILLGWPSLLTHIRACLQARFILLASRYTSVNLCAPALLAPASCVIPDALVNNL